MVPGLADIAEGFRPLYPMTVYVISGDDASGIAGMVYPSGGFLPTPAPTRTAAYWGDDFVRRTVPVKWQGSVAGSINLLAEDGDGEPARKRDWDASLHDGPWVTTGELWRAMERGTGMRGGQQAGRIHDFGGSEDFGYKRAA